MRTKALHWTLSAVAVALLAGCGGGGGGGPAEPVNVVPPQVYHQTRTAYTATAPGAGTTAASQDLLTGGLGKTGIGALVPPAYADPLNPTALELRRNAIYANYRAVIDPSANGGYGSLYGPNIDLAGANSRGEGLVPGVEYLAKLDDGTHNKNVVLAVQIPTSFDVDNPCLVIGPSSGSRGVYGAIGTSADWGLKKGCAVALTDAGKGMGLYDPMDDTVNKVDGTRATQTAAGILSHFAAIIGNVGREAFNIAFPNRLALKHVHSRLNPEQAWGRDTNEAVVYALYALNQEYGVVNANGSRGVRFTPVNTMVIAGSVSNGGAAVLQAGEQDAAGLIDGIVAGEPLAQPKTTSGYGVMQNGVPVASYGKSAIDYFTYANIYQPCAALAPAVTMAEATFFNFMTFAGMNGRAANRCEALAAKGLVSGADQNARATDALAKLRAYGWLGETDFMHNAHYGLGNAPIIAAMYTNAYGRFSVLENMCGMSFAQVNATGDVIPVVATTKAQSFAVGNGTANGVPATPVYNNAVGGSKSWAFAISPSSGLADFALDAALCQRALVTGVDPVSGTPLNSVSVPEKAHSDAVKQGVADVQLGGHLRGKPTIIVAGRHDALLPVNHNARAYVAYNRSVEGAGTNLHYYEVMNAQHFDTFLNLSGWDTRFVPLHTYFVQSMNMMYAFLKDGTNIPPSQVVRTTVRGGAPGAAPAISAANVPPIVAAPAAGNQIGFTGTSVNVPN
ncbi:MAG: hydrogenase [Burkholderiales bacterium]|nr:hydrogenase [Burkholderiales bacterium]